jgi:choline dehydrogenase-like flavoprotein
MRKPIAAPCGTEPPARVYSRSARARMGSDDAAVVDERLTVHNASGLKVFNVSVVRSIISGNTNIAMTIAEKAAYMISSRHGLGAAAR